MTFSPSIQRAVFAFALVLGLTLIVWVAFNPALTLGFTGWDTINHVKTASERVPDYGRYLTERLANDDGYYRPISGLSYGLNYALWGANAFGYHLTDVAIHWLTTLGVLVLGYQATRQLWAAGLVTLLFTLNPLVPPTVTIISQRHDTLMTLGIVWTLALLYAAFHTTGFTQGLGFAGAWLAFVVAVGAKETGLVALPLVLWMSWRYRHKLSGKYSFFWQSSPFVLVALAYVGMRQTILYGLDPPFSNPWDFQLPSVYLQEVIAPRLRSADMDWLAVVLVLVSVVILALPLLRNSDFQTWFVLFCLWIGVPILLYTVVGVRGFRDRYAYVLVPPLALLFVRLLIAPLTMPAMTGSTVAQLGSKLVLAVALFAWLPFSGAQFIPVGLFERETGAGTFLQELDRLAADLPAETIVDFENVPSKLVFRNSIQTWFDLKWDTKRLKVGSVKTIPSHRVRAVLTMTQHENRATISAKYLPISRAASP